MERPKTLGELIPQLLKTPDFARVVEALARGHSGTVDGAWGSAGALATAAVAAVQKETDPVVVVLPRPRDVEDFVGDLQSILGQDVAVFPAWESLPEEHSPSDPIQGQRLQVLRALESPRPPRLVVATMQACLQPVPSRTSREATTRRLKVGQTLDLDEIAAWLTEHGFERAIAIEAPGEFSIHGGILDIFALDTKHPLRIELFGDEIESIRSFEAATQQKVENLAEAAFSTGEQDAGKTETDSWTKSFPLGTKVVLVELTNLVAEGRNYHERLSDRRGFFNVEAALAQLTVFPSVHVAPLAADGYDTSCHLQVESIERFSRPKKDALKELASILQPDEHALVACHNAGALERLAELLKAEGDALDGRITLCLGTLTKGFRLVASRVVVLSDNELFGRVEVRRTAPGKKSKVEARAIDSFLDLQDGDLIVHLTHGIGRFRGMQVLTKEDQAEEHMHLEFRDGVQLYVPVSLIHLVQKYVGGTKAAPELSKLGGTAWAKKKEKVAEAITDMAADMLKLAAEREGKPGIAYPPDSKWMEEFEAAFPYQETEDQLKAIGDIKGDMQRPRPMDRLICGDVGYGKTEVAMRAAFKAVDGGKQVAVLVPTTVLAEQHFRSFSSRMAEFPMNLEQLSRFRTKAEQKQILAGLKEGSIDLIIGTHRIVQKDVKFKDLGLVIIDEEQRFGVEAKEMLKQLKLEVDVLTLSATPIPRTLHLSLIGVRDISNLETPPHDRIAVETRIARFDNNLIRQAIVRELNRGGQVYFVHNRVYNIQSMADRIRSLVPECTVDVVHGQMGEHEMEAAMVGFVSGKTDVLVATTIIESGLDIPNANTIFIHEAEIYGLADLHQLRGRVGRYKHRAYCYLLLAEGKVLAPQAAKRLKAIEEYSELGAGFKIAMRDLEIRGAGNILGTEQSGHIAVVGYELYCQLLENAVRALKKQPLREHRHVAIDLPISAFFPPEYIPPGRPKIEMYRRLSNVQSLDDLESFKGELRDRFGPIPAPAQRMIDIRELQLLCIIWQVESIHLEPGWAVFAYRHARKMKRLSENSPAPLRIVDEKKAYLSLPKGFEKGLKLLKLLRRVLKLPEEIEAKVSAPAVPPVPSDDGMTPLTSNRRR